MILILNPYSCHGKGIKKWEKIHTMVSDRYPNIKIFITKNEKEMGVVVRKQLEDGESIFIAGGGDGTLNFLLNFLMLNKESADAKRIAIGSIGLGSSNDFHKPRKKGNIIQDIPCRVNIKNLIPSDVGKVEYIDQNQKKQVKYFIVNASVGVTACANYAYNHPSSFMRFLKKSSVDLAILYAAISTIVSYKNQQGKLDGDEYQLSNLAILKIPYFSRDFFYEGSILPDDGKLHIRLSYDMSKMEMLQTLIKLTKGHFSGNKTQAWSDQHVKVEMKSCVPMEIDGEVFLAKEMHFSILPKCIDLCS